MEKVLYPGRLSNIALTAFSLFALQFTLRDYGTSPSVMGLILVALCASGALVGAVSLLPGASWLKLHEEGFTQCSLFRQRTTRWEEVDKFQIVTTRQLGIPIKRHVGWTFATSRKRPAALKAVRFLVGFDAALADNYGMKAQELAVLLETWRQRAPRAT